jgi:serine/threonine protein kinase/tetratricopeptide (TPR) repeat protein
MGEVWRGRHLHQDVPVAIKVLNPDLARDDWAHEAFTNEVRAAAGLEHPGIMMLLDQGMVSPEEASLSQGQVQDGSPYLVMELVDGRPLHHWAGRLSWPHIHSVLRQLLEALAHSHARGVIHRDIKPGNVLVEVDARKPRSDPERLHITLTDFGLAQALERHSRADRQVAGTPAYMAPEQLRGRWRDQGPWTDLYSVGCLGWAMTTGEPPFGRKRPIEDFCHDHLHLPPPPLDSSAPVPRDLEAWLRRLLQKRPEERFIAAADALFCLDQLRGSLVEGSAKKLRSQLSSEKTRPNIDEELSIQPEDAALLDDCSTQEDPISEISTRILDVDRIISESQPPALPSRVLPPISVQRSPIPETWERQLRIQARKARGVGLSLYGLSPAPMVNRFQERDALWQALREVDQTSDTRVVLLEGPSGCGKSRLAQWLCEEANARAGVTVLRAGHSQLPEPSNGLSSMLALALRCRGLPRRELVERLAQVLPRIGLAELDEVHALAELISPATESDQAHGARTIRFHDSRERYHLIRRVLQRVGSGSSQRVRTRNVIIWLDDLQWGQDALAFADYLIRHPELNPAPILVVGTVQLGALEERREEAALLHMLRQQPQTRSIPVDALSSGHHRELIKSLIGNEGQLVERVARRTAGNPLFAVQLVGDWVERGVLLTGPGGVVLQPGVEVELPDNLHAIWDSRIERFLDRHESKAGRALEVAATLGDKVDRREWRAAAEKLGVRPSPALVAGLIRHRLVMADPEGGGWSFSHPMLRECLERRARNSRRANRVHLACARMLQERVGAQPGSAERIGTHLLRGGEAMEALAYFLRAAEERYSQGAFHQVSALLNDWEQAMVNEGMPASEPMWGRGWLLRGRVRRALGNLDEALQVIARAMKVAEEQGWPDVVASCLCEEGVVLQRMGDWERGWRRLRKAGIRAEKLGDESLMANVLNWQGDLLVNQGRLDEATAVFEKFRELSARIRNKEQEADSYFQLGRVDKQAGRLAMARSRLIQSLELFESIGARWGTAKAVNELGEVDRLENRLSEAASHYRQALEKMEELGLPEATVPRLNLALVMMQQGDYRGAQPLVEHAHEIFGRSSSGSRRGITHLMLLICSIAQDHWSDWDHHLSKARLLFASSGFVDIDVAMCAMAAGDMACEGGYLDRARSAWDLAIDQWLGLDRPLEAEQVRIRMKTGLIPGTPEA